MVATAPVAAACGAFPAYGVQGAGWQTNTMPGLGIGMYYTIPTM